MKKLFGFTLLAVFIMAGSAYAAVTHSGSDIYGDNYTVEDSSGNWTYASNNTIQGNLTVTGTVTESGVVSGQKRNVILLANTASTVGTVTIARSGSVYVLTGTSGESSTYLVKLPATGATATGAFTGETYTFVIGTTSTLAVITPFATDSSIAYGTGGGTVRITSPASSGSTVTVIGNGRTWYVSNMSGGYNGTNAASLSWTPGTTA